MAAILIYHGKSGRRKEITLKTGISIIGRRPECDVRIPQLSISRNHCRIVHRQNKTIVQDLGSTNGTYVNTERISEAVAIDPGDVLSVGPVRFVVQIDGKPQDIAPPPPRVTKDADVVPADSSADKHMSGISKTQITEFEPNFEDLAGSGSFMEEELNEES